MFLNILTHFQERGFWIFLLWTVWATLMLVLGTSFGLLFTTYTSFPDYYGYLPALVISIWWYKLGFTRKHPLLSSLIFYLGLSLGAIYLTQYLTGVDILQR